MRVNKLRTGNIPGESFIRKSAVLGVATNAALVAIGVLFLTPLAWLLASSFDKNAGPSIEIPKFTLNNYETLLNVDRMTPLYNSLLIAASSSIILVGITLMAGYGLSRYNIPLKRVFLIFILFSSAMPIPMIIIPVYQIYVDLGWINSRFTTSLFIAASSLPFAIWIVKSYIDEIPVDYDEAAAIDGALGIQVVRHIILPLALPSLLVAGLLTFVNAWNAFLIPLVLDSNPAHTPGSLAIYQFLGENAAIQFGPLCAYSILYSLPVLLIYAAVSRWIIGGFGFAGGLRG